MMYLNLILLAEFSEDKTLPTSFFASILVDDDALVLRNHRQPEFGCLLTSEGLSL